MILQHIIPRVFNRYFGDNNNDVMLSNIYKNNELLWNEEFFQFKDVKKNLEKEIFGNFYPKML